MDRWYSLMLSYLSRQSIYCGDGIQYETCDNSNVSSKKPWIQIVVGDANIKGFDKTVFCKIVSMYHQFSHNYCDTTSCVLS